MKIQKYHILFYFKHSSCEGEEYMFGFIKKWFNSMSKVLINTIGSLMTKVLINIIGSPMTKVRVLILVRI